MKRTRASEHQHSLKLITTMKTLKTLSITLALILFAGVLSADAQQRGMQRGLQGGGILSPEMTEALQLTDQQRLQLLDLRNAHLQERQALRETFREGDTTPNAMRASREAMQNNHQAQLQQILTEDQYARLQELREERRELNRSQRPGSGNRQGTMRGGDRPGTGQGAIRGEYGGQRPGMQGQGNRPRGNRGQ